MAKPHKPPPLVSHHVTFLHSRGLLGLLGLLLLSAALLATGAIIAYDYACYAPLVLLSVALLGNCVFVTLHARRVEAGHFRTWTRYVLRTGRILVLDAAPFAALDAVALVEAAAAGYPVEVAAVCASACGASLLLVFAIPIAVPHLARVSCRWCRNTSKYIRLGL